MCLCKGDRERERYLPCVASCPVTHQCAASRFCCWVSDVICRAGGTNEPASRTSHSPRPAAAVSHSFPSRNISGAPAEIHREACEGIYLDSHTCRKKKTGSFCPMSLLLLVFSFRANLVNNYFFVRFFLYPPRTTVGKVGRRETVHWAWCTQKM